MCAIKKKSMILKICLFAIFLQPLVNNVLFAQLLGTGFQTVIKTEYQYSDYLNFTYPDPILYQYPDAPYSQPSPYISSFPEHRFMTKITQYFGFKTSLGLRYQWSEIDKGIHRKIYNVRPIYEVNDQFSVMGTYQYMELNNQQTRDQNLAGHMGEIGFKYNFAGFIHIEPSYGYYTSSYVSPEAEGGGANSFMLKLRQTLTNSTAIQAKYVYFVVNYDTGEKDETFDSNTLTLWLSQYFETETAVHLSSRFYWSSMDTRSYSPALEIVHYIDWDVIARLSYRYYHNKPQIEEFLERIKGDSFSTHAFSTILDYSFSVNTNVQLKYRYYTSDQNVDMNTYLISLEQIL